MRAVLQHHADYERPNRVPADVVHDGADVQR